MSILVTGAAGFIGYHVCKTLLGSGRSVVGVDNLNDYYDPTLKQARIDDLVPVPGFTFHRLDVAEANSLRTATVGVDVETVIHLASQVGVRSSIDSPRDHVRDNLCGQLEVLEYCRAAQVRHLVHASTSAVYGASRELPYQVTDRAADPLSLYAATKRGGELLARSWSALHDLAVTTLRFFTVYGPWGRPDMATWIFTDAIINGRPIRVHGGGEMRRGFTYIDDAVTGVVAACDHPPPRDESGFRHATYNLGNPNTESVNRFIAVLEQAIGKTAQRVEVDAMPGEMWETMADIELSRSTFGFDPRISIEEGLPRFVEWYSKFRSAGR